MLYCFRYYLKYKLFCQKPAHSYLPKWLCWAAFFKLGMYNFVLDRNFCIYANLNEWFFINFETFIWKYFLHLPNFLSFWLAFQTNEKGIFFMNYPFGSLKFSSNRILNHQVLPWTYIPFFNFRNINFEWKKLFSYNLGTCFLVFMQPCLWNITS